MSQGATTAMRSREERGTAPSAAGVAVLGPVEGYLGQGSALSVATTGELGGCPQAKRGNARRRVRATMKAWAWR